MSDLVWWVKFFAWAVLSYCVVVLVLPFVWWVWRTRRTRMFSATVTEHVINPEDVVTRCTLRTEDAKGNVRSMVWQKDGDEWELKFSDCTLEDLHQFLAYPPLYATCPAAVVQGIAKIAAVTLRNHYDIED